MFLASVMRPMIKIPNMCSTIYTQQLQDHVMDHQFPIFIWVSSLEKHFFYIFNFGLIK